MWQAVAPRASYRKTAGRRADIVQAAFEAFAAEGYDSASLRSIAARAGISHTGLLHHFPTKEELLAAVLERREVEDRRQAAAIARPVTLRGIVDVLRGTLERHRAAPEFMQLWASLGSAASRPNHPANPYFSRRYKEVRDEMARGIEAVQASGEVDPTVDAVGLAAAVLAVMDGLQVQWLLDPGFDIDRALTAFFAPYLVVSPVAL